MHMFLSGCELGCCMVLIDGAGPAHTQDATIRGAPRTDAVGASPHIAALVAEGILLDRHHTYLWCSPTRRAFLTGRYPVHITGIQAPTCSNLTPLQFTILSEKLAAADYESHFIGKGPLPLLPPNPPRPPGSLPR
eukprot:COSAG01_NODE_14575_length_1436_cov_1.843680_2_plen_135_part_00